MKVWVLFPFTGQALDNLLLLIIASSTSSCLQCVSQLLSSNGIVNLRLLGEGPAMEDSHWGQSWRTGQVYFKNWKQNKPCLGLEAKKIVHNRVWWRATAEAARSLMVWGSQRESVWLCFSRSLILVPRAYNPFGLWLGSRALVKPDFLSMRRVFVSHSQPIRFARFDGKSVNRGLPVLDQTRALDPNHRPEGSWVLGTRMSFRILNQSDLLGLTGSPWIADFRFWTKSELSITTTGQKDRGLWGRESANRGLPVLDKARALGRDVMYGVLLCPQYIFYTYVLDVLYLASLSYLSCLTYFRRSTRDKNEDT